MSQEVELNKKRPQYIKSKEKTAHMIKKLEGAKYVMLRKWLR